MEPLISIIIPIYNGEKHMKKCLDSIINQTYKNLEIILIDDGSLDKTREICEHYSQKDKRIKVINKLNEGVAVARNTGIENSNGEYCVFCDSDDTIESNTLELLVNANKSKKYDCIIYGSVLDIYDNELLIESKIKTILNECSFHVKDFSSYFRYLFNSIDLLSSCNKLFDLKIIKKEKIKFSKGMVIFEDFNFNIQYLVKCKNIKVLPNILYHYRHDVRIEPLAKRKKINIFNDIKELISNLDTFIKFIDYKDDMREIKNFKINSYLLVLNKIKENIKNIKYSEIKGILKHMGNDEEFIKLLDEELNSRSKILKIFFKKKYYLCIYFFLKSKLY